MGIGTSYEIYLIASLCIDSAHNFVVVRKLEIEYIRSFVGEFYNNFLLEIFVYLSLLSVAVLVLKEWSTTSLGCNSHEVERKLDQSKEGK